MELQEHVICDIQESAIDADAGIIRNVKILGRISKRGYRYSDQAFHDARQLYENCPVNFDHPDRSTPGVVRPFMEQVGMLQNCKVTISGDDAKDGVYGDMPYLRSHPGSAILVEAATRFPKRFGLSHNAHGSKEGNEVNSIDEVRSVDIVTRPATNTGLFESEDDDMTTKTKKRTVQQIKADAPAGKWTTVLLEADPAVVPPGMEVETPEETDPAAEIKAALEKAVVAVVKKLFNGELEEDAAIAEIKKIIGMKDEATGGGEEGGTPAPESPEMESIKDQLTEMQVKNLLLESGREASQVQINALKAIPESQRQSLVESWPAKDEEKKQVKRPAKSPGQNLQEDEGDYQPSEDAKSYVSKIKAGV